MTMGLNTVISLRLLFGKSLLKDKFYEEAKNAFLL